MSPVPKKGINCMKKENAVKVTKEKRYEMVSPNKELLFKRSGGRDRRPCSGPDP
jgi:hypothetical protein